GTYAGLRWLTTPEENRAMTTNRPDEPPDTLKSERLGFGDLPELPVIGPDGEPCGSARTLEDAQRIADQKAAEDPAQPRRAIVRPGLATIPRRTGRSAAPAWLITLVDDDEA